MKQAVFPLWDGNALLGFDMEVSLRTLGLGTSGEWRLPPGIGALTDPTPWWAVLGDGMRNPGPIRGRGGRVLGGQPDMMPAPPEDANLPGNDGTGEPYIDGGPCEGTGDSITCGQPPVARSIDCGDATPVTSGWVVEEDSEDFKSCELDLIAQAWGLLVENLAQVDWAVCMATGNPSAGDCIRNFILGENADIKLSLDTGLCFEDGGASAQAWAWSNRIILCPFRNFGANSDLYCYGDAGARACAILDMAALLLHEITHQCFRASSDISGDCEESYLIQNNFKYLMFQKCDDAALSPCCSSSFVGTVGDSFGFKWPNTDCLPEWVDNIPDNPDPWIPPGAYPYEPKGFPIPLGIPRAVWDDDDVTVFLDGVELLP